MIYIGIPAHDEADTIGVLLWKIRQVMSEFQRDYQLIVLDDASTDDTVEVLAPYGRVLPLTVLENPQQRGYAASLERIVREVVERSTHPRMDVLVTLQADFTERPEEIPELVKRIEGGADVVGASAVADPTAPRSIRWSRRGLPWMLRRIGIPEPIGDALSGFRAYRLMTLRRAVADRNGEALLSAEGWAANLQLLMAVAPHARRLEAAEVSMRYDLRRRPTRFRAVDTARAVWRASRDTNGGRERSARLREDAA